MEKYTKQIYVQVEEADEGSGDPGYLLANRDVDDVNDGEVAIYEFVGVKNKTTNSVIE